MNFPHWAAVGPGEASTYHFRSENLLKNSPFSHQSLSSNSHKNSFETSQSLPFYKIYHLLAPLFHMWFASGTHISIPLLFVLELRGY